jgi:hypothetical protein
MFVLLSEKRGHWLEPDCPARLGNKTPYYKRRD